MNDLDVKCKKIDDLEAENLMIDTAIQTFMGELARHTLQVYTLTLSLTDRDPTTSYEAIQSSLEKTGLHNIFGLYWGKVCHILKSSLTKYKSNV